MEGPLPAVLLAASVIIAGFGIWTWIVVHEAATEAREYFRRQNAAARIEDAEADEVIVEEDATR